ncbi:MAG TPA: asparaginase [Xanthobacteraceae bacterium]|nr:asparaginase [Xanthobacteraceae bacterium]
MARSKLLLVSLGGTITMTSGAGAGIAPTLTGEDLVRAVPALAEVADIETASPFRLPGASLTIANLRDVARLLNERLAGDIDGAIVVQGTDTIEETAFTMDVLVDSDKPVVVVGAMRGAEAPGADGPSNLLAAAITASAKAARGLGTLVVLNDTIHAARFVQKGSTYLPSAFVSFSGGPLGAVIEGEAKINLRVARFPVIANGVSGSDQPVALLTMALGDDGRMLPGLPALGYRGLVIEAMGAGHVPAVHVPALAELAAKMPVVLSSRVAEGPVFAKTYGFPGSEIDLLRRGLFGSGTLGGLKARLLLSLLLGTGLEGAALREAFARYV